MSALASEAAQVVQGERLQTDLFANQAPLGLGEQRGVGEVGGGGGSQPWLLQELLDECVEEPRLVGGDTPVGVDDQAAEHVVPEEYDDAIDGSSGVESAAQCAQFLETVGFDRPRGWTMHNGGPIEVTFTCRLEPVPEGTRLHAAFEPTPHGWFRLIFPIFLIIIRRQEKANMGHLHDAFERRAGARA